MGVTKNNINNDNNNNNQEIKKKSKNHKNINKKKKKKEEKEKEKIENKIKNEDCNNVECKSEKKKKKKIVSIDGHKQEKKKKDKNENPLSSPTKSSKSKSSTSLPSINNKETKQKEKKKKKKKKKKKENSQNKKTKKYEIGACVRDCGCECFYGGGGGGGGDDDNDNNITCQNCGHNKNEHQTISTSNSSNTNRNEDNGTSPSDDSITEGSTILPGDTPEEINRKFKAVVGRVMTQFTWEIDPAELVFKKRLGEGASAKVFRGEYRGQDVAIKVLKERVDPAQLRDFKKEFELMTSLRSAHIVFFFGACVQPSLCMVMEWCSNGSLHDVLNTDKFLDWPLAFKFLHQTMRAINGLHEWKPCIVHRDLKSLNLLVDASWTIKVADFGLSRTTEEDNLKTLNKLRGTYAYSAPEVYFGNKYTTKADIFSLSIIIWEIISRILTGTYRAPYSEYKQLVFDFQIIIQTAKKNLRPTVPENCPQCFADMMTMSWRPESEERPSCTELLAMLKVAEREYEANKEQWDALIPVPQPITK